MDVEDRVCAGPPRVVRRAWIGAIVSACVSLVFAISAIARAQNLKARVAELENVPPSASDAKGNDNVYGQSAGGSEVDSPIVGDRPKSLIFMLSDGMGLAVVAGARQYRNWHDGMWKVEKDKNGFGKGFQDESTHLTLDSMLLGTAQTRSANSHITDSAAGITAYSCGSRTNNLWVAKLPKDENIEYPWTEDEGLPCKTTLEKAKEKGMLVGVVVKSRFTHATPAGFGARTVDRNDENRIAYQMIEKNRVDIIIGGGSRHLLPKSAGGKRNDNWNGFERAAELGYRVIKNEQEYLDYLAEGTGSGNLWSPPKCQKLLLVDASGHRPYDIDRTTSKLLIWARACGWHSGWRTLATRTTLCTRTMPARPCLRSWSMTVLSQRWSCHWPATRRSSWAHRTMALAAFPWASPSSRPPLARLLSATLGTHQCLLGKTVLSTSNCSALSSGTPSNT
mmetsp:Transcript_163145/g.518340  ORF Transcript_163145/g.518340 Transcript_163145/m.518340 type:complete len:450 (-) Transcript_163145:729-2078(-)